MSTKRVSFFAAIHVVASLALCLGTGEVWAQKNRKPPEPAVVCTVADFRMLALSIHEPKERADKAMAWVQTYGAACTPSQLTAIISSRPSLMGTADNQQLASQLDRLLEVKMSNDKAGIERLYRPDAPTGTPSGSPANPGERVSATAGPASGTGAAAPPPVVPEPAPVSLGVGVGVGVGTGVGVAPPANPAPRTP